MPVLRALFPGATAYGSALEAGLSALNPVVHPPGVLMNAGRIERSRGEFWFYEEGVTPSVVNVIEAVDRERLALGDRRSACDLTPVAEAFHRAGFGPAGDFWAVINGSRMLTALRAPGQVDTRWLTEDIPYGLATWAFARRPPRRRHADDGRVGRPWPRRRWAAISPPRRAAWTRSGWRASMTAGCARWPLVLHNADQGLDDSSTPARVYPQLKTEAMTRTSTRRGRAREPRSLRSGTRNAGEEDLRAPLRTGAYAGVSVGGGGRPAGQTGSRYRAAASRLTAPCGKRWPRKHAAAKWGGTTGMTPLVP